MNRVSAEVDIRYALREYYATRIAYPQTQGFAESTVIEVEGDHDGLPYGDFYQPGDVFLDPVGNGQLGRIYYVQHSQPGSRKLRLQLEHSPGTVRPKVVLMDGIFTPEVTRGRSRVHIGIRSRATARAGFVRALYSNRVLHEDRQHIILTEPFWRGSFWLHVEGQDRLEVSHVFELINTRIRIDHTPIYKFLLNARPIRVDLVNLENGGVFRSILSLEVEASLTPATPLDQLPDGMPQAYFPFTPIEGVTPVVEPELVPSEPPYGEATGHYPLTTVADESAYADMFGPFIPPEEE